MEEDTFSTSLCEAEFKRIGLKFWTGDSEESPVKFDIHTAASVGDREYISSLPPDTYDMPNSSKWTPLMYACYLGHRNLLNFLLHQNCDITKVDHLGRTPLTLAGMCGNLEMLKDIFTFRRIGKEIVNMADNRNFSALSHAVHGGHLDVAEYLLKHQADPDLTEHEKGYSLLMIAAAAGNTDMTNLLLNHNADTKYENALGDTVLSVAEDFDHKNIISLLRRHEDGKRRVSALSGPAAAQRLLQQRMLSGLVNKSLLANRNDTYSKGEQLQDLLGAQSQVDRQLSMSIDKFLRDLGLEKYIDVFREQEIDFELLLTLTDNELKQIGVNLLGPRRKITVAVANWKQENGDKIIT